VKVLLVSDIHHFSTFDCFVGYCQAFKKMGIDFDVINMADIIKYYSHEFSWSLVSSKMLNKENDFTHVLFISGLVVPDWLLKSKYDKKIGIIGLDDPHSSQRNLDRLQYLDYYFTNEKKLEDTNNRIYYLPTATSFMLPTMPKDSIEDKYKNHIVFIGSIYDNRIKPLEEICRYCKDTNKSIKIIGPHIRTPKDSIIREFSEDKIISNNETKMYYYGANIVINMERDVNWNPFEKEGNSLLKDVGEPYSTNPRTYEIAGCRSLQLSINPRQETISLFGDNIVYCNIDEIKEVLEKILSGKMKDAVGKINNCFDIVSQDHTYLNRAKELMDRIVSQDLVDRLAVSLKGI
jgi:hypothetical protein